MNGVGGKARGDSLASLSDSFYKMIRMLDLKQLGFLGMAEWPSLLGTIIELAIYREKVCG
jgi:hypothetical protein